MEFKEGLPDQCPPAEAVDNEWDEIYRLLPTKDYNADHFKSHAELGKSCHPNVCSCRWASCSLVFDTTAALKKFPRFKKYNWAARMEIPKGSGMSQKTNKNHVDFWQKKSFDMTDAVKEVVAIS